MLEAEVVNFREDGNFRLNSPWGLNFSDCTFAAGKPQCSADPLKKRDLDVCLIALVD